MNPTILLASSRLRRTGGVALLLALTLGASLRAEGLWVATKVFNGYERAKLPDGSFKPERYTFADAGRWDSSLANDSVDKAKFLDIARLLAPPLAQQSYLPSHTSHETDLLILVAWGTTQGSSDVRTSAPYQTGMEGLSQQSLLKNQAGGMNPLSPEAQDADAAISYMALANKARDEQDFKNAKILGFEDSFVSAMQLQHMGTSKDLLEDLEENRYFVVLKALDFKLAAKEKKLKILWEARFSIPATGEDFMKNLPSMTQAASRYFGKSSGQLIRPVPEGKVKVGEPKVVQDPKE